MPGLLVTVCARAGSEGVPGKALREFLGEPLIVHSIRAGLGWPRAARVVVSTDSEEIAAVARSAGAEAPFIRPAELAGAAVGKLPVIAHALAESEAVYAESFDAVADLDLTSPFRTEADLERAWELHETSGADACFSVVAARKNPYFNMVERRDGEVALVSRPDEFLLARQAAPPVWEINGSIYVYRSEFLRSNPSSIFDGRCEIFEMPGYSRFDIDSEDDLVISEALARRHGLLGAHE